MSEETINGFPKNVKSVDHFLAILKKKGGELDFVPAHYNSEKGTGKLHSAMWSLEKANLISIEQVSKQNDNGITDTLFMLKITPEGIQRVNARTNDRINRWLAIAAIIISLIALLKH